MNTKNYLFLASLMFMGLNAYSAQPSFATKNYEFQFKNIKKPIIKQSVSQEEAFKLASKECFNQLTGGKYPGEEKGMDIIDICANPKMKL